MLHAKCITFSIEKERERPPRPPSTTLQWKFALKRTLLICVFAYLGHGAWQPYSINFVCYWSIISNSYSLSTCRFILNPPGPSVPLRPYPFLSVLINSYPFLSILINSYQSYQFLSVFINSYQFLSVFIRFYQLFLSVFIRSHPSLSVPLCLCTR